MADDADMSRNTLSDLEGGRLKAAGLLGRRGVLVVLSGEGFGTACVVPDTPLVVGRQEDCGFVLHDPLLSRRHFQIGAAEDGEFFLEDLGSKNSTFHNAQEAKGRTRLHYGDRIMAGGTVLRFLLEEQVEKKKGRPAR
jgi:predicted component of type VI protein secretion system